MGDYSVDHGVVDVSNEPVVNRDVPQAPVLAQISAVPPLFVELAVGEVGQLSGNVEEKLESRKEQHDPSHAAR